MTISADLRTFLLADATISGLVAARVYPIQLPQNPTLPAVRYTTISDIRTHTQPGVHGLARPRVQIDCYGATYASAVAVSEAVRDRLDAYRGTAGSATIQGAFFQNGEEFYEADMKAYLISRDFYVWYGE